MTARDLAERVDGGMTTLKGLLAGSVAIDAAIARSLAGVLGGDRFVLDEAAGQLRCRP
ncbi:hypothetical protein AB5I41_24965 [Sphingomonas sp. MMS24-JH45]